MRACCKASARTVITARGAAEVVDCPQCDRGRCSSCKATIAKGVWSCRGCGTAVRF